MNSLNTLQIDKKLENIHGFLGAFPYDELPKSRRKLFSLVVNTSSSHEPGDHWLALVYRNNAYYFLDSYGRDITDMTFPEEFKEAIKRYVGGEKILYNRKILQQILSNACGDYAIYFVRMFSSGDSLKKSLTVFTDNLKYNDVYVTNFVKHLMN